MTTLRIDTVTLPASWACALMNGDFTGMTPDEETRIRAWQDSNQELKIVGCAKKSRFTWSYDLYDPGASCVGGEVLEYDTLMEVC